MDGPCRSVHVGSSKNLKHHKVYALSAVLSTEGRFVGPCWEKLKPPRPGPCVTRFMIGFMDLLNWLGTPIKFPPNLSFSFVVEFIRAYLRGASFGARLNGGT